MGMDFSFRSEFIQFFSFFVVVVFSVLSVMVGVASLLYILNGYHQSTSASLCECSKELKEIVETVEEVTDLLTSLAWSLSQQMAVFVGSDRDADVQWPGDSVMKELIWLRRKTNTAKKKCLEKL